MPRRQGQPLQESQSRYPPIADYAYISDCHSGALISRAASIDWCCMPRVDQPSLFGRLLDWERGGYCLIEPVGGRYHASRWYLGPTMVLETTFTAGGGEAKIIDCFTMRKGGRKAPYRQLLRVVEGVRGKLDFRFLLQPRFDYGEVRPWIRRRGLNVSAAIGGSHGLLVSTDSGLDSGDHHDLVSEFTVRAEERVRLSMEYFAPEMLEAEDLQPPSPEENDARLEETLEWWRRWAARAHLEGPDAPSVKRSALVLRALVNAPTGAIAAAPTTSLPERIGGIRNWDYRFSWIRDSAFSVRSLTDIGCDREADGFRRFIQRSAAGSAHELQIMYGLGGERRLTELELPALEGYRRSRPVRIGNGASNQLQLDAYGELVQLSWHWHVRGQSPDDDYWRFLLELVEAAYERWREPDHGLWEVRGQPRHFVYSKVMCWLAIDRGIQLATECLRKAPLTRWRRAAAEIKATIDKRGFDRRRGVFVQFFGGRHLDAALLLLPSAGFVDWQDPRMVATVDAIREELMVDGLLRRYQARTTHDGLPGQEGVFLPASFWLAEALARQGRLEDAREVFDRAASTCNDLGLFAEEYNPGAGMMLGNFPQGLTHLSHMAAAVALSQIQPSATHAT
ncbi:MAG: glycoside hydrolase family 15 protein [Chloroflexi bacterium]|nr:MAG: glycoside hydrolase family 15 protein [Chloroflexota bacterium]